MKRIIIILKRIPKPNKSRKIFIAYLMLIALIGIPIVAYNLKPENKVDVAQAEIDDLKTKVGMLMDIPDETPTVASISDASKLRNQQFFAKAQNNDKVLIFTKSQKAILYRPSTNKIIEVALYKPPVADIGEVAGTAVSLAPTPLPTKAFSLEDLLNKTPSIAPTQIPTQAPPVVTITPTPAL